jgi:hypothetical protein
VTFQVQNSANWLSHAIISQSEVAPLNKRVATPNKAIVPEKQDTAKRTQPLARKIARSLVAADVSYFCPSTAEREIRENVNVVSYATIDEKCQSKPTTPISFAPGPVDFAFLADLLETPKQSNIALSWGTYTLPPARSPHRTNPLSLSTGRAQESKRK